MWEDVGKPPTYEKTYKRMKICIILVQLQSI